jgi:hypothetical protein
MAFLSFHWGCKGTKNYDTREIPEGNGVLHSVNSGGGSCFQVVKLSSRRGLIEKWSSIPAGNLILFLTFASSNK